jgi:hypothetical protein
MAKPGRSKFAFLAILIWLEAGFIFYVYFHPPISLDVLLHLAQAAWDTLAALWLLALGGGLVWRWVRKLDLAGAYRAGLASLLGVSLIAIVVMVYGTLLPLNVWGLRAAAVLATGGLLRPIRYWGREGWGALKALKPESTLGWGIALPLGVALGLALLKALAPPLAYDALVYHLALPRMYLAAGQIATTPINVFSGTPQTAPMAYVLLFASRVAAPAALGWWWGILAVIALWHFLRQILSNQSAWLGIAMLFAGKSLFTVLTTAYTESAVLLIGILALILYTRWRETRAVSLLLALGALLGAAYNFKQSYTLLAVTAGLLVLWDERRNWAGMLRSGAILAGGALLLSAPWLLRAWLSTGNPVFPLLFPAGWMTPEHFAMFGSTFARNDPINALLLPLRATFWGIEDQRLGHAPDYQAEIGPLLLLFSALCWIGLKRLDANQRPFVHNAAWFGLLGLAVWAVALLINVFFASTRYFFWLLPAFTMLAAIGLNRVIEFGRAMNGWRILILFVVLAGFAFAVLEFSLDVVSSGAGRAVLGYDDEQTYLENNLGVDALIWQDLRGYPPGSVKMIYEARNYYCYPMCLHDDGVISWFVALQEKGSAEAVLEHWQSEGIAMVLVRHAAATALLPEQSAQMRADFAQLEHVLQTLTVIEDYGSSRLYALP